MSVLEFIFRKAGEVFNFTKNRLRPLVPLRIWKIFTTEISCIPAASNFYIYLLATSISSYLICCTPTGSQSVRYYLRGIINDFYSFGQLTSHCHHLSQTFITIYSIAFQYSAANTANPNIGTKYFKLINSLSFVFVYALFQFGFMQPCNKFQSLVLSNKAKKS